MKFTDLYSIDDKPDDGPDSYDALPAGAYAVKITSCGMKETKNGNGKYLNVEMTVVDGGYEGRKIFDRLNLVNDSLKAVRIAKAQFASLREATGILNPKDPADLMGIRFQVMVKCKNRKDKPEQMENVVQRYIKKGQTATTPQQTDSPKGRTAPNPDAAAGDAGAYDEIPF